MKNALEIGRWIFLVVIILQLVGLSIAIAMKTCCYREADEDYEDFEAQQALEAANRAHSESVKAQVGAHLVLSIFLSFFSTGRGGAGWLRGSACVLRHGVLRQPRWQRGLMLAEGALTAAPQPCVIYGCCPRRSRLGKHESADGRVCSAYLY